MQSKTAILTQNQFEIGCLKDQIWQPIGSVVFWLAAWQFISVHSCPQTEELSFCPSVPYAHIFWPKVANFSTIRYYGRECFQPIDRTQTLEEAGFREGIYICPSVSSVTWHDILS